ncbi:PR domain zinc finger protein 1-like [Branchiostoma floridae]|uniref:PR domain zinc finger protein 1-like n=1 Tax=Branchiostoma floridae TaxID=7739 RepID=A0A9J7L3I3_BRAFL|nr:PR domain zinc finger protein 1-like [Branchiostoma floridae]XP_035675338.1 PR domain zinc finger protein 1-like [Branchiostoma floridae]XP_035675339.1 PR domain zinc finger protein 1-like [Branchiostoma floridae]XP_035675340.1 PR domain zinc finger protein 1-like [Branchiostoma floridae]XP_035675341.1 PR domain zinc finger protein 1-like [Branchiostoma floridae]XP_035675342.1 PR domain zinc finger protein 1-like [Branchiostoma floridae]XP_035675343.1 PR domain zinc finger protein 1-like [
MARQKKDPTKRPQEKSENESKVDGQASPDPAQVRDSGDLAVTKGAQAAPGGTLASKIVELMFSKMGGPAEVFQDSKPHKAQANGQADTSTPTTSSATAGTSATTGEDILDLSVKTRASTSSTREEVRVKEEGGEHEEDSEVFDDVGALDLSVKRRSSTTMPQDAKRRRSSENSGTFPTPPCTPKNTSPNFVFSPTGVQNGPSLPVTRGLVVPPPAVRTAHHALGATVVAALMGQSSAAAGGHPAAITPLHQLPAAVGSREAGVNLTSKPVVTAGHPPMIVNHHGQPTLLRFPYALPPGTFVAPPGLPGGGPRLISPHLLATLRPPLVVNRHLAVPHPPINIDNKTGSSPATPDMKAPHLLKYMTASQASPPSMSPPDRRSPNPQENHHGVRGNAPLVFTCKTCGIPFPTVRKLAGHMKIHNNDKLYYSITVDENGQDSTIYVCQTCGTQFTIYENLISHMQHHGGEDMYSFYICEVCNARFTQASDLKIHSRIHIRDKPFTCDICKNKFTHLQSLKTHQRIHTGEKPYQCKVCQARFTQLGHLKAHSRIHTGEKPYQCGTCGAKFSQLGTLKVHMRIHTGEKPYQCKTCDARFTHLRSLKLHTLRSHMDDLTQAEQDQLKQDTGTASATQQASPEPQATASAAAASGDE